MSNLKTCNRCPYRLYQVIGRCPEVRHINPVWNDTDLAQGIRTGVRMSCPGAGERVILADRVPNIPEWAQSLTEFIFISSPTFKPTNYYQKFIEEINRE